MRASVAKAPTHGKRGGAPGNSDRPDDGAGHSAGRADGWRRSSTLAVEGLLYCAVMPRWSRIACVLLLAAAVPALGARDPAGECSARKLEVASRYVQCRLAERVRGVRKGHEPDFAACDARLAAKLGGVERKLGQACPSLGDLGIVQAAARHFADGLTDTAQGRLHCSEDLDRIELGVPPSRPIPSGSRPAGPGVIQVAEGVYMAAGFGNTFLVVTPEGNVVIDTSLSLFAPAHVEALRAIDAGPIRYIILTHGHNDHTGGVPLWREEGTQVIAQREQGELLHYSTRLGGVLNHRSFEQFSLLLGLPPRPFSAPDAPVENYGAELLATTTFDRFCEFRLGGLTFQLVHTPGETYDHLSVWIPEYRLAFTGDNIYGSFPNIYTLRGTKPRWALDYVESLERVQSWQPEILAPSHEQPIYGADTIRERIRRYRDAILFVHDATVRGMNAGADVFTLMDAITLPTELDVGEGYGSVAWTVRGIYEGYLGWFDENPATMYPVSPQATYRELVALLGGPEPILTRAAELAAAGRHPEALRLTDVVLASDAGNRPALELRLAAVNALFAASRNINEQGWLNGARRALEARLAP
jgi:glyoxylase-like metal-dependent hydrolase (beta-lactamase superfamily II)